MDKYGWVQEAWKKFREEKKEHVAMNDSLQFVWKSNLHVTSLGKIEFSFQEQYVRVEEGMFVSSLLFDPQEVYGWVDRFFCELFQDAAAIEKICTADEKMVVQTLNRFLFRRSLTKTTNTPFFDLLKQGKKAMEEGKKAFRSEREYSFEVFASHVLNKSFATFVVKQQAIDWKQDQTKNAG